MPMTSDTRKAISAEAGGGPIKSELNAITVFYKMNPWVQFGFEESHYASYAVPNTMVFAPPRSPGCQTARRFDWRTEFGPVFTF